MDFIEEDEIGQLCLTKQFSKEVSLDSFEMNCVIGKGQYAKVLLVRKKDTKHLYALKVLKKSGLKQDARIERNIMIEIQHPFIIKLVYAFQTASHLYFCMEYCPGGEMYYLLSKQKHFNEHTAMFYAAQIILALEYLHSKGIIYRELNFLKPENIVICQDGYVKLTDFGLCKKGDFTNISGASSICGTPAYMAPEILQYKQYGKAVDWWAFGCFLYEMVAGHPPFFASNKQDLEFSILHSQPNMSHFSIKLQDLIYRLLEKNPKNRLTTNIRDHQWFNIDFDAILNKKEIAPFLPTLQNEADVTYFDPQFIKSSMSEQCSIIDELDSYKDFTYKGSQDQSIQQSFQTLSPEIIGLNENGEAKQMIKVESTEMINQ